MGLDLQPCSRACIVIVYQQPHHHSFLLLLLPPTSISVSYTLMPMHGHVPWYIKATSLNCVLETIKKPYCCFHVQRQKATCGKMKMSVIRRWRKVSQLLRHFGACSQAIKRAHTQSTRFAILCPFHRRAKILIKVNCELSLCTEWLVLFFERKCIKIAKVSHFEFNSALQF